MKDSATGVMLFDEVDRANQAKYKTLAKGSRSSDVSEAKGN